MAPPIVFVDTETTCLGPLARPWEVAVIRREDGATTESVLQVEYSLPELPEGTAPQALHVGGWLLRGAPHSDYLGKLADNEAVTVTCADEAYVAHAVHDLLEGEPVLVGVGVHFDAAVLSSMFQRHGLDPEPWHYAIVDLKAETHGYLHAMTRGRTVSEVERAALHLPLSSELLAAAVGVEPPDDDERHTALGDARWAARWFDVLTGGAR